MPPGRRRFAIRVLAATIALGVAAATLVEKRRLAQARAGAAPAPPGSPGPPALDQAALLRDVQTLSSDAFEGRRTATDGGRKAAEYLSRRFAEAGLKPFGGSFRQPFTFEHTSIKAIWRRDRPVRTTLQGENVVGQVAGRTAGRWLVVSAHYDHLGRRDGKLYPGADDNASGVGVLLALAAHFAAHPPRHSLVFAAFDAEELGLRGAQAFVARPPVPLDRVSLDLNLDMVGRSDRRELFAAGPWHYPALRPFVEEAARGARIRLLIGHDRPIYAAGTVEDWTDSSDHAPFHEKGIPFLYLGVEEHAAYHQPGDTWSGLDQPFLLAAADLSRDLLERLDAGLDPSSR